MEEKFDLEKEYNILKKKAPLPKFSELDSEFEISSIKEKPHLIRNIRRKMNDKIIFYCRILEGILFPTQASIISFHEGKHFSDEEKSKMREAYKKLMYYERKSLSLDVSPDEKQEILFINEIFKNWNKFKVEIIKVTSKMQESWKKEESIDVNNYTG